MRRRKLLVLGAGPAQLGLLEAAARRDDVHVIAVDRDPAAVGFPLADERAVLSTEDEPAVDRLARARDVDGLISPGADWPVGIAARVAERLGVAHPIDGRTGAIVTSKLRQRERFAEAGVPHPRTWTEPEAASVPCVVKAPDRQGQRGLGLVRSPGELATAVADAREASRGGGVLVEELIEGPEVTVNAISVDGAFVPLAVADRLTAEPPAFGVALAHVWPSPAETDAVLEVARAAVEAVGIRSGPSYTQLRVGPGGPVVMEVAARLGGGHDAELVEAATGVDLNALAVGFALGEPITTPTSERRARGAAIVFLVPPAGELVLVDGVEDATAGSGVEWVRIYRRPGHVFGELRRGADRAGAVLATGSTREEAEARAHQAARAIRFVVR
ncbi:MAG: ATP-grasp domain-containing protein [Gaiellales bacterium]